jgi:hypothetical protein
MTLDRRWRKSSFSNTDSDCVELPGQLDAIRDSKNPTGPALELNRSAVSALLHQIRTGEFHSS